MFKFIKSLIKAAITKLVNKAFSFFRKTKSKAKSTTVDETPNTASETVATEVAPEVTPGHITTPIVKEEAINILLIMGEADSPKAIVEAFDAFSEKTQGIADVGSEDVADTVKPVKKPTAREIREARRNKRRSNI